MRVLIGCEFSGVVRDAFIAHGHDAISCDLLPTESPGPHHTGDVLEFMRSSSWDLAIFHPPCTDLAVSGARWFPEKIKDGRQQRAIAFFMALANADIPRICVENPVGIISSVWRKPDQIIQPHHFGHDASKSTCLWLKNLPPLTPTKYIGPRIVNGKRRWGNQTDAGQNRLPPSPDRWALRSLTYPGIAQAMAAQWGRVRTPGSVGGHNPNQERQ